MTIVSSSTSAFFDRTRTELKALRTQADDMQSQLSTGNKLNASSDDPVAASRLRQLSRLEQLSGIDTANANRANADLTLADSTMSHMADAINRAQELATQAANGTLSNAQRASIGDELLQIQGNLVALANTRDSSGNALFGGENSGNAYTLDASGNAGYVGQGSAGTLPLGEGQSVTRTMTGPEFLTFTDAHGNQTDVMATIKTLSDALKSGSGNPSGAAQDALASLQTGLDTLTTGQTVIGTRLAWIDVTSTRRTDLSTLRSSEEADLGNTDIASTIARLQETMTVLQASQASFAKLSSINLFSVLN